MGDLGHKLDASSIELLAATDILMIPVGGNHTIDAKLAAEVVAQLEPHIVVPMHYQVPSYKFDLDPVEKFLKEMGKEDIKPQPKLSITKDKLPEEMEIVVLD